MSDSANPFSSATPTQANVVERRASLPILQWLGSPNHHGGPDAVGFFIGRDHIENMGLDFKNPPEGVEIVTRSFSSKSNVQGWAPPKGQPWSLYVIRSAFRWAARGDKEFRQYFKYEDAEKRAQAIGERAYSKFRALVMVREIGPHALVLSAHGTTSTPFSKLVGFSFKHEYHSIAQRMAHMATQYARDAGNNVTWGIEAFAIPIVPADKPETVGKGSSTSRVVMPEISGLHGVAPDDLTIQHAIAYFNKEDDGLWGAGGVFELWLEENDDDPENLMSNWKRMIAVGEGKAEDAELEAVIESGGAGFDTGALADRFGKPTPNGAPSGNAVSRPGAPPPPAADASAPKKVGNFDDARAIFYPVALNDGFTARDEATERHWSSFYDAMRVAGLPANQNLAGVVLAAFCPTNRRAAQDVMAATYFLRDSASQALIDANKEAWALPY